MTKFIENFMFGLAFGCGFCIAYGVLKLIAYVISHGGDIL